MFMATSCSTLRRLTTALVLIGCCTLAMTRAQDPQPNTPSSPSPVTSAPTNDAPPPVKPSTEEIRFLPSTPAPTDSAPPRKSIRNLRSAGREGTTDRDESGPKPFTGYLKIRQQNGTLTYDINILKGKVVSGTETYRGSDAVTADIVGGWFSRDRLVLMIQSRNPDIANDWTAHLHQFRRTADGFTIDHSLLGYGKSDETDTVYRPHTIDRIVEFE